MHITVDFKRDGLSNMAADVGLLEDAELGNAQARIYTWDGVWVTLGRNQKPSDALLDLSVPYIIRPTGGAAVLHGHDLTIGIAMPLAELGCTPREVKRAYLGLVSPILVALNEAGVPAVLGRDIADRGSFASPYCFGMKSDYDVLNRETGEKICGCAMRVTDSAALLQASIPISKPVRDPSNILRNFLMTPLVPLEPAGFIENLRKSLQ